MLLLPVHLHYRVHWRPQLQMIMVTQTGIADVRMGGQIMLVAFIATVIGGLGSLSGAVAAGFLIGAHFCIITGLFALDARPFRDAFLIHW